MACNISKISRFKPFVFYCDIIEENNIKSVPYIYFPKNHNITNFSECNLWLDKLENFNCTNLTIKVTSRLSNISNEKHYTWLVEPRSMYIKYKEKEKLPYEFLYCLKEQRKHKKL